MKDSLHFVISDLSSHSFETIRAVADDLRRLPRFVMNWKIYSDAYEASKDDFGAAQTLGFEGYENGEIVLPFPSFSLQMGDETGNAVIVVKEDSKNEFVEFHFVMDVPEDRTKKHAIWEWLVRINFARGTFMFLEYQRAELIPLTVDQVNERIPEFLKQEFFNLLGRVSWFLFMLHMSYARTETIDVTALNRRRARMNRPPVPVEHRVIIDLEKLETMRRRLGGTHASPVGHERRAHVRHLRDGRIVPVRATSIKGGSVSPATYEVQH